MNSRYTSDKTTNGIRVQVFPEYIPEQSLPEENKFLFAYKIKITNNGSRAAKLLTRHWIIINANGESEEVKGPGVVGYQPYLNPDESFEYTSYCPLNTSWGTMEGSYRFIAEDEEEFDAEIGRFYLVSMQEAIK
jgi:ApaG protein